MFILLGFSFLAGLFTALSPCILPILPAILTSGIAQGKLRPLGAIVGLTFSFSFFTLTLSWMVQFLGLSPTFLRYVAIVLIFFFGLVMIFPSLSIVFAKWMAPMAHLGQKIQESKLRSGFWGGLVFGVALGLLWTPCAGPILGAITTLAATQGISLTVILMTLSYSCGAGVLMLLYAYGSAKILSSSRFLSRYTERIRQFFGVLMLLFALMLFFNWDLLINRKLAEMSPKLFLEKQLPSINMKEKLSENDPAPEITGITAWIHSSPLSLSELKGKVVLIDFWTYTCINCIRTIPHVENWHLKYKDQGLVIIGVHTPEFQFEKSEENVKKAVQELGITYPVALDNEYATWNAYQNSYWPAHYLIDQMGYIRMAHFGEGNYTETENGIRDLLGMVPLEVNEEEQIHRPLSPETYLGLSRGHSYGMKIFPSEIKKYQYKGTLQEDQVGLKGLFSFDQEYITAKGNDSYIEMNFLASQVYLVLGGTSSSPIEINLDGKPYETIRLEGDKKYNIVSTSYGRHQLSIKIPEGVKAYVFTFGGSVCKNES